MAFLTVTFSVGDAYPDNNVTDYSVEELVAAVSDKLTSIESIDCEYSVQYGDATDPIKCRFARSGSMWRYEEIISEEQNGLKNENILSYDDRIVYSYTITHQTGKEKWGFVELQDPRLQENHDPDEMLGLKLSNISRSIIDVFKRGRLKKSENKLLDGTMGITMSARDVPRALEEKLKYDVAITFDPNHDMLPREILITESEGHITWPGWEQRWKILEFRQLLDESTNHQRWFPVSAILTQGRTRGPTIRMKADKIRINPSLPMAFFRPDIPEGTTVSDVTVDGRGKLAIKGSHFVIGNRIKELTDQARSDRKHSRRGWQIFAAIAMVVLSILFFVWRTLRRRSKVSRP